MGGFRAELGDRLHPQRRLGERGRGQVRLDARGPQCLGSRERVATTREPGSRGQGILPRGRQEAVKGVYARQRVGRAKRACARTRLERGIVHARIVRRLRCNLPAWRSVP